MEPKNKILQLFTQYNLRTKTGLKHLDSDVLGYSVVFNLNSSLYGDAIWAYS